MDGFLSLCVLFAKVKKIEICSEGRLGGMKRATWILVKCKNTLYSSGKILLLFGPILWVWANYSERGEKPWISFQEISSPVLYFLDVSGLFFIVLLLCCIIFSLRFKCLSSQGVSPRPFFFTLWYPINSYHIWISSCNTSPEHKNDSSAVFWVELN